jgi:hypothetical protein
MRFETLYEKVHQTTNGFKYLELKSGRRVMFWDAKNEADDHYSSMIRWVSRMFKLANDESDLNRIDNFVWHLESLVGAYRAELERLNVRKSKEERIAQLRDVSGRTPEEAALYLAKADQLEAEL